MAGRLWMDACAASNGVMAMIADRLALPRAGRDGRPEAGDAVIAIRRGSGRKAGSNDGAPGVWLLDGTQGLDREDVEQMLMAGVRLDPALLAEFAGIGGSDGCAGAAGGAARCAGAADADAARGPDGCAEAAAGARMDKGAGADVFIASERIGGAGRTDLRVRSSAGVRLFEVPVFHLRALAVRRIGPGAHLLPADWDGPHPLRRRLESAAVRALYAAGRDFGTVLLAAADDGAVRVAGPFGEPVQRDFPLWLEAVGAFRAELADEAENGRRRELLIGADPEFLLVGPDGRVVSAARFFPRDGAAGSDTLRVRGQLRCPVAELRPDPAPDPDGLLRGIRGLLRRAEAMTAAAGRPLRWLAGGMPVPGFALGGHLHMNVPPSARLLRVLDSCVALPLAAAEDARGLRRRPRYGALGDFRFKPYGFEYRTPPSWLVSPLAAQAAFAAALLAARHAASLAALTGLPSETEAGRRAYYAGDRDALREMALKAHDAMRRVPGYAAYRRWIAPFFAALERGAVWREDADFRPKWGLPAREAAAGGAASQAGGSGRVGRNR